MELIGAFLWLIVTGVASIGGYITIKKFVRERLRFVDGVQKPGIPLIAGVAATALAIPTAVFPIITPLTAVLFGIGIGTGVAAGRRQLKQLPSP
ncbi:MAG: hypothetical protein MJB57_08270 [Gemmatimonadetes bacterium]|nr:hypothetical protein [Gemmatimonadota bacterium]